MFRNVFHLHIFYLCFMENLQDSRNRSRLLLNARGSLSFPHRLKIMGNAYCSRPPGCCSRWYRCRIWVIGMADAGKTSVSQRLALGKRGRTAPTVVFDLEKLEYNGHRYVLYDWGYMCQRLWWSYDEQMHGIIFVVDSSDPEMLKHSARQFSRMLKEERTKGVPILVYANKQDRLGALSEDQIKSTLPKCTDRPYRVQPCSVSLGIGLYEGLEWLDQQLYQTS